MDLILAATATFSQCSQIRLTKLPDGRTVQGRLALSQSPPNREVANLFATAGEPFRSIGCSRSQQLLSILVEDLVFFAAVEIQPLERIDGLAQRKLRIV